MASVLPRFFHFLRSKRYPSRQQKTVIRSWPHVVTCFRSRATPGLDQVPVLIECQHWRSRLTACAHRGSVVIPISVRATNWSGVLRTSQMLSCESTSTPIVAPISQWSGSGFGQNGQPRTWGPCLWLRNPSPWPDRSCHHEQVMAMTRVIWLRRPLESACMLHSS